MLNWWNELPVTQQIFYMIAIPSTVILLIQTILLMFGLGDGHDADFDADSDGDVLGDHDLSHDMEAAHASGLRILTIRGIIAFLAMFGWTGVAALDMGAQTPVAFALAFLSGIVALIVVALIIRASFKLQQSGNLDMQNAVGQIGEVYLTIPKDGHGKVTLVVQERYLEMDAVCHERTVKNGEQVKVVSVTPSNTLIVSPLYETVSQ
ncbi:MAG: hypothetical protein GX136_03370 [Clostridiales bacterium]|jgi:membrane protein implicated in regulation of membrane protease activity|nr:hypothetical protein [Clostridiales bacterium]